MQRRVDAELPRLVGSSTCGRPFISLMLELEDLALRRLEGRRVPHAFHPALRGHTLITAVQVGEFLVLFALSVENKCVLITESTELKVKALVLHPALGVVGVIEAREREEKATPAYIF